MSRRLALAVFLLIDALVLYAVWQHGAETRPYACTAYNAAWRTLAPADMPPPPDGFGARLGCEPPRRFIILNP